MDCREFQSRLTRMQESSLSPDECQAFEDHLSGCPACSRLSEVSPEAVPVPADWIRSVLDRTSGPACRRVQDNLCDFVDGALESGYRELMSLHLKHCRTCSALAAQLSELRALLPQMAERDPGVEFTYQVLRKISGLRKEPRPGMRERMRLSWIHLIQRPRFSWEAAYLGTVLLVVLLGNPLTSALELTHRAAKVFRSDAPFSWTDVALPGSLIGGESEALRGVRELTAVVFERQQRLESSAKGLIQQGALILQASRGSVLEKAGRLPTKCKSALRHIRTLLFPGRPRTPAAPAPAVSGG